jgi:inosine/xanthosine triphosphatase
MKIIVGSLNPVKINAAKSAFSKFWKDTDVSGTDMPSDVSHMPMTEDECIKGAINRARKALNNGADFGVGLEGGVKETEYGMFLLSWAAVADKEGNLGLGSGGSFALPEIIAKRIMEGEELGPVMDDITNTEDVKKKQGAIGFFTDGKLNRTTGFETAILFALTRFVKMEMYRK